MCERVAWGARAEGTSDIRVAAHLHPGLTAVSPRDLPGSILASSRTVVRHVTDDGVWLGPDETASDVLRVGRDGRRGRSVSVVGFGRFGPRYRHVRQLRLYLVAPVLELPG